MTKSPKTDRLREMREAKHEGKISREPLPYWKNAEFIEAETLHDLKVGDPVRITRSGKAAPIQPTTIDAARMLGSTGGKSKSPAKQAAAKENGKRGGKPKRLGSK